MSKKHKCMEKGCNSTDTIKCRLLDPDTNDDYIYYYYCSEHCHKNGFCWYCGEFWGGIELFDFSKTGLCCNCIDEVKQDLGEYDEDEIEGWEYADLP
jgi:hypothetical protein